MNNGNIIETMVGLIENFAVREMYAQIPDEVKEEFNIAENDVVLHFLLNVLETLKLFNDLGFNVIKKDHIEGVLIVNSIVSKTDVIFEHIDIELGEIEDDENDIYKNVGVAKIDMEIVDKELLSGYLLGLMIIDSPVKYSYEITEDYLIIRAELDIELDLD